MNNVAKNFVTLTISLSVTSYIHERMVLLKY